MAKRPLATPARELTPRQITFTKHLLTGATITEAARKAGYSERNLAQSGHQALQTIRLKCPELMVRLELTPQVLIEKYLVPLLSATKTKFFLYKGKVIESRAFPDHHTRLLALDMVFRLMGAYAPNQSRQSPAKGESGVRFVVVDAPRPPCPPVEKAISFPASQPSLAAPPRESCLTPQAISSHGRNLA